MTIPETPDTVRDVLSALRVARYPASLAVTKEQHEAVEDWLLAVQTARREEWREAGSPEEWPHNLSLLFVGPNMGIMFKGVELLARAA